MQQQYVQKTRNPDGTESQSFQVLGASMDEIDRGLSNAGFVRNRAGEMPNQLPKDSYDAIMRSNPKHAQLVRSGNAVFRLLGHRQYLNPSQTTRVDSIDYGLNRVTRVRDPLRALDYEDPFIHITYLPGDPVAAQQVKEIVTDVLKRKFVQVAATEGTSSKRARRCVMEVALINEITGDQAAAECMDLLERVRPEIAQSKPQASVPGYWRDDVYARPRTEAAPRVQRVAARQAGSDGQSARDVMSAWRAQEQRMFEETDRMIADMNRFVAETLRDMHEQTARMQTASGVWPRRTLYA